MKPEVNLSVHSCEFHLRCQFGDLRSVICTDNSIFYDDLKMSKIGQGDPVFVVQGSVIGVHLQVYKSVQWLRVVSSWLTSRETHRQTDSI